MGASARAAGFEADMQEVPLHQSVMPRETVEQLVVRPGGVYVDGTAGEGGHSLYLLQASAPSGVVLGVDRDPRSLARAQLRLLSYGQRFIAAQGNYADMVQMARDNGVHQVDGVLLDLGMSSWQLEAAGGGFSFQRDEYLDMRYDPEGQTLTAADIVNTYPERELSQILYQYGEETRARAIARAIVRSRPINTTGELARLVSGALHLGRRRIHSATRTFQALRIAVNEELANLEAGLEAATELLRPEGRLAVISYHSLEDRLVKNTLSQEATSCICPPEFPVCICQHQPTLRIINRRVIRPAMEEMAANPRSRSARMRVAQRL